MDDTDEEIHTRWLANQLLMAEASEGLQILCISSGDDVQNNCWWMREIKESIPYDVRKNCYWIRPMKDYPYQMMYKATAGGRDEWRKPYQMMYETTVEGWDQWSTTHTRWYTKQLLIDEKDEGIHTRWRTKQQLMSTTNEEPSIPDDVQNNCWWMREIKESISDDVRNNCCGARQMQDYRYQMMYKKKQLVIGWERWMNPCQLMYELLMYMTNDGLPIPDGVHNYWWMRELKESIPDYVQNNRWWLRQMKDYPYQMVYKTTVDGWWRTRNPYQIICEATVDGWGQWRTTHTRWCTNQLLMDDGEQGIHTRCCTKQLLMDDTNEGLPISDSAQNCEWMRELNQSIPDNVRNNLWVMRPMKDYPYQMMYKTTVDGWERSTNPYHMMYETTVEGWNQWSITHTRWHTKQLFIDERDWGIHARWCTKQLSTDETNDGLPIPDDIQNNFWRTRQTKESTPDDVRINCWWLRPVKDYRYQMMYKTTVDGWNQWRTTHTGWCTKQPLVDETDEENHTRWCAKQLLRGESNEVLPIPDNIQNNCWWMREMKKPIQDDVRNNCLWIRRMIYYLYEMMFKITVDGWGRSKNPYQMTYEATVDGWDQWRTTHTRWWTKLLMDERVEGIHTRLCTNNCWWVRPIKDYPYQMMYKTTVDGRERSKNPYQMMYETTAEGWNHWSTVHTRWHTKQLLIDVRD